MLKTKDFYLMKVFNIEGKYLGVIDDICINFYSQKVEGFFISNFKFFSKKNYFEVEDIISVDKEIIVKKIKRHKGLAFKEIKYMDIIDKKNIMRGVLEDIIISRNDMSIKGLVMSSGVFDKMIRGKDILLLNQCVLGEDCILYTGNSDIILKAIPRKTKR